MRRTRHLTVGVAALLFGVIASFSAAVRGPDTAPVADVLGAVATPAATAIPTARPDVPRLLDSRPPDRTTPRAGRGVAPRPPAELTGYVWPLAKGRITLPFKAIPGGTRYNGDQLFHDGVDMATFCGDYVRAAHDGLVLAAGREFDDFVGWVGDLRPYYATLDKKKLWDDLPIVVVIDDGNGYRSVYAHFREVSVAAGDRVEAGEVIGREGATGHASGCHVHYSLFSPFETDTFGVREDILKRLKLPNAQIARIDPILVLPDGPEALRTRRFPVPPPVASPAPFVPAGPAS